MAAAAVKAKKTSRKKKIIKGSPEALDKAIAIIKKHNLNFNYLKK